MRVKIVSPWMQELTESLRSRASNYLFGVEGRECDVRLVRYRSRQCNELAEWSLTSGDQCPLGRHADQRCRDDHGGNAQKGRFGDADNCPQFLQGDAGKDGEDRLFRVFVDRALQVEDPQLRFHSDHRSRDRLGRQIHRARLIGRDRRARPSAAGPVDMDRFDRFQRDNHGPVHRRAGFFQDARDPKRFVVVMREGRNAVFLATLGLDVHAVDGSEVGLAKAAKWASTNNVTISTEVADLSDFEPAPNRYGGVVSIFAHLPKSIRDRLYPLLVQTLRPGGILILEAYSENQYGRGTGGPRDLDLLMTCDKIEKGLVGLEPILLREVERQVVEGKFHTGMASVIQYVGKKPDQT